MRRATIRLLAVTVFVAGILFLPPLLLPNRFFYRNGRPTGYGRFMSALWGRVSATGLMPAMLVNLEVEGRGSGRPVSVALAAARLEGETYLVSMLGEASDWVRNVRAAGGRAWVIRRGRRPVGLEEVPVNERPAVLRSIGTGQSWCRTRPLLIKYGLGFLPDRWLGLIGKTIEDT